MQSTYTALFALVATLAMVDAGHLYQSAVPVAVAQPICSCPAPQVQIVEKIVKVPEIRTIEKIIPQIQIVEKIVRVPEIRTVEKIVTNIQTVKVPVDRIVEVPVEKIIEKRIEVPVQIDRIVEKRVPVVQIQRVEVPVVKYIEKPCVVAAPPPAVFVAQGQGWGRK